MLDSDAPAEVWADVWLDDTRQVLALHLVNGDIDAAADRLRPIERSRWRVRLPAGLAVAECLAISPDESSETKRLPVEAANGWATVVVPRIECYTIVALYSGQALTAASNLASARRALWRDTVSRGGRPNAALEAERERVLSLLRAGQLGLGALAAAELARRCDSNVPKATKQ